MKINPDKPMNVKPISTSAVSPKETVPSPKVERKSNVTPQQVDRVTSGYYDDSYYYDDYYSDESNKTMLDKVWNVTDVFDESLGPLNVLMVPAFVMRIAAAMVLTPFAIVYDAVNQGKEGGNSQGTSPRDEMRFNYLAFS